MHVQRRTFNVQRSLALALTLAAALPAAAQSNDPILQAMQTELARSKQSLVLPGMQHPYFIEYRVDDVDQYTAVASYGSLTNEDHIRQRIVRVQLRIGDFKVDSSSARGDGSAQLTATDNNPLAIRYALWTATDEAYKAALNAYSRKQADLKRFENPPSADDFSPAQPTTKIEPLVHLEIDRNEWKHRIVEASGLYASDSEVNSFAADIQTSTSDVRGLAVNRYLVNTDGTILRRGYTAYAAGISVSAQAPDGMRLSRENGPVETVAAHMESAAAFRKRAINDLLSLRDLRNAPIVTEEYHGPVLFSSDAATDVFNQLFVPNIEADKPQLGTTARTQGSYASSYKSRVLPNFFNVTDDPSLRTLNNHDLLGAYDVDDEGTPAQKVDVVSKGILQNYVIGRTPVKDFPASNGHGRAAIARATQSRAGVIQFTPTQPVSEAELNQRLTALAKEQDRPFVFAVETLGGELSPRLLYRVTLDGKRELVRGAAFDELDQRSLRSDIIAAGDKPYVLNSIGPIPTTTIAPAILFGEIEVKRAQQEREKLPYYNPPATK